MSPPWIPPPAPWAHSMGATAWLASVPRVVDVFSLTGMQLATCTLLNPTQAAGHSPHPAINPFIHTILRCLPMPRGVGERLTLKGGGHYYEVGGGRQVTHDVRPQITHFFKD